MMISFSEGVKIVCGCQAQQKMPSPRDDSSESKYHFVNHMFNKEAINKQRFSSFPPLFKDLFSLHHKNVTVMPDLWGRGGSWKPR